MGPSGERPKPVQCVKGRARAWWRCALSVVGSFAEDFAAGFDNFHLSLTSHAPTSVIDLFLVLFICLLLVASFLLFVCF